MSTSSRQKIVHPCRREMPEKPGWLRPVDIPEALRLRWWERRRLRKLARQCRDPALQVRYRIVVALSKGMSPRLVAEVLGCSRDTVYVVQRRWIEYGEAGLIDRREDNGSPKVAEEYVRELRSVLEKTPPEFGWARPTWTRELLLLTMQEKGFARDPARGLAGLARLTETHEQVLLQRLGRYPEIVEASALTHEPHQLAYYLRELAADFHLYYNTHTFLVEDGALRDARLNLIDATRQVLANGLGLLGVSAPESMYAEDIWRHAVNRAAKKDASAACGWC